MGILHIQLGEEPVATVGCKQPEIGVNSCSHAKDRLGSNCILFEARGGFKGTESQVTSLVQVTWVG